MLSQTQESTRQLFLKNFTAELILNYKEIIKKIDEEKLTQESFLLQKKQKETENDEIREKLKQIINKIPEKQAVQIQKPPIAPEKQVMQIHQIPVKKVGELEVPLPPESELGEAAFNSVEPSFLPSGEIDFKKITPFIKDPAVSSVECKRAEEKISIKKLGQTIDTDIKLNEREINSIIKAFSEKTRIPIIEGILKTRSNNLEIFAVISKFSTSRFIITKIFPILPPMMPTRTPDINKPSVSANPFAPKNPAFSFLKKS